jgi:DNA-binding response OmpR family regulator
MRVLVVEDDPSMAASLVRGLSAEGYVVKVAADGERGRRMATEENYDIVVPDIMLPKLNGFALVAPGWS